MIIILSVVFLLIVVLLLAAYIIYQISDVLHGVKRKREFVKIRKGKLK